MKADKPIIDVSTLRRDLYLVMGLLLADGKINEVPNMTDWTQVFYENEVGRLMLWVATATRSLLDGMEHNKESFNKKRCGEYWTDFPRGAKEPLTFRRACNSVIHAEEILPYKSPRKDPSPRLETNVKQVYIDRITVRSPNRGKHTRAHLDIIKFVQIANAIINSSQEDTTMPTYRDTYKYHFKMGNKIVHTGITNDLERREAEHQQERGWSGGHIKQVGYRTTRENALAWEREQLKRRGLAA